MMNDLAPVLVIAIITFGIYKLFDLYVRRNERMAIIEKFSNGSDPRILGSQLDLPLFEKNNTSWPIRIGLLLVGIGLGTTIAAIVDLSIVHNNETYDPINVLYPACASIFGGLGLVIAYFIEKKNK